MSTEQLIETYSFGGEKLAQAVRGLSPADLVAKPPADANVGRWSIHEIAVHLSDADGVLADRMKRVIAEDRPQLLAYDENKWMAALAVDRQSAEEAVALFQLIRKQMATILRNVPAAAWERYGVHTEVGNITLAGLVERANRHLENHLKFVHAKRAFMGKEMW